MKFFALYFILICFFILNDAVASQRLAPVEVQHLIIELPEKIYDQPIHVFISGELESRLDAKFVLFLHGWLLGNQVPVDRYINEFHFSEFIAGAQFNGVLVVPLSKDKNETYLKFLTSTEGYDIFWTALLQQLNDKHLPRNIKSIDLIGHSGAGFVISSMAKNNSIYLKKIKSISILDGLYSQQYYGIIELIAKQSPLSNLYSAYISTENPNYFPKGNTATPNQEMVKILTKQNKINFLVEEMKKPEVNHFSIVSICLPHLLAAIENNNFLQKTCF